MNVVYVFAGMVIFWSLLLTVIFRFERRMAWPFGELQSEPPFADPTGYGTARVAEAVENGFTLLGWARDLKGPKYCVSYAVLVSPERNIFAVVGAGSILQIRVAATQLYTPTSDGRCFYSTDHQAGVQIDLSHQWTNQLVPGATFPQLLQEHQDWIRMNQVVPRPLTCGREIAEFRTLRQEHYLAMERTGLIGFTDASANYFRFTFSGAARTATWSYFLGMARQLSRGRFPRNA
ncbi:MAG: hypothetical protein WAN17_17825 [Candidatus Sulfotelmatobacter sp.]